MGAFATLLAALALAQAEPAAPKPLPIPMGGFPEEAPPPPAPAREEPAREEPPPRAAPPKATTEGHDSAARPEPVEGRAAEPPAPAPPPARRPAPPAPAPAESAAPPVAPTPAPARPRVTPPPAPDPSPPPPRAPPPSPTPPSAAPSPTPPPSAPVAAPAPGPDAERAAHAARAFLEALRASDPDGLAAASAERFSFDGETRTGAEPIKRAWREIFAARPFPAPPLGTVEILPAEEAIARHGKPPSRIAGLVRPGVFVAVADLGGRPVVLFLAKDGDRFAVLGMHD